MSEKEIKRLGVWDFPDKVYASGPPYDPELDPASSADNMRVLMDKLNEVIDRVNEQ